MTAMRRSSHSSWPDDGPGPHAPPQSAMIQDAFGSQSEGANAAWAPSLLSDNGKASDVVIMDAQLPLSHQSPAPDLGLNDQACNECFRRKGKCDRQLPECGPCARNRRHCLYARHSKTPLTRKHLTSLEERLRQVEHRCRQSERRAQNAEARLQQLANFEDIATAKPSPKVGPSLSLGEDKSADGLSFGLPDHAVTQDVSARPQQEHQLRPASVDWQFVDDAANPHSTFGLDAGYQPGTDGEGPVLAHELEAPPSEADDFSWDEQSVGDRPEGGFDGENLLDDNDSTITDGMASLSVEDKGAGYLGVASGAAMLRLLLPDAEHRRPARRSIGARLSTSSPWGPADTNDDEGWVSTPVWRERGIGEIDVDRAIDSYFSLYHLSYPLVHEPSFRAQYAQVLPRPNGRSWNALAYMLAAIGMFTTSTQPVTRDLDLFEAAKANISIDSLESGNITLVQVLVLMSNYLQKRNKPNSGYNYLGLALYMAMGLGLHKEFHNWRIAPLTMEIRRRVWYVKRISSYGEHHSRLTPLLFLGGHYMSSALVL